MKGTSVLPFVRTLAEAIHVLYVWGFIEQKPQDAHQKTLVRRANGRKKRTAYTQRSGSLNVSGKKALFGMMRDWSSSLQRWML